MSAALLDVNVLIALLDPRHVHHEPAHRWFATAQAKGWATCPLTQNAVLRILGQPRYPNSPGPPAVVAPFVAELIRHPRHQFWPDGLSLLTQSGIDLSRLLEAGQLSERLMTAEGYGLERLVGPQRHRDRPGGPRRNVAATAAGQLQAL